MAYSKGGYELNKNGKPISTQIVTGLGLRYNPNDRRYHYRSYDKVGRYKPTPHNISII